jgi:excinuclease UvrABC nuclease subunit
LAWSADADYARDAPMAEMFLNGKDNEVIAELSARMQAASEALRFEQAAVYRDQIQALSAGARAAVRGKPLQLRTCRHHRRR